MTMAAASLAFFVDVRDFPTGGHFAVLADDAAAPKCGETDQSNETHDLLQFTRGAMCMPPMARDLPHPLELTFLSAKAHEPAGASWARRVA